jgi:hemoglobin
MTEINKLFDKYGGFSTISAVVHKFYEKIGNTPKLDHYFSNADMAALIDHQTKFLSMVLGGPNQYTGRTLGAAHSFLKIKGEDFDLVGEILQETLEESGVEAADVGLIMGVVVSVKNDIVAKAV